MQKSNSLFVINKEHKYYLQSLDIRKKRVSHLIQLQSRLLQKLAFHDRKSKIQASQVFQAKLSKIDRHLKQKNEDKTTKRKAVQNSIRKVMARDSLMKSFDQLQELKQKKARGLREQLEWLRQNKRQELQKESLKLKQKNLNMKLQQHLKLHQKKKYFIGKLRSIHKQKQTEKLTHQSSIAHLESLKDSLSLQENQLNKRIVQLKKSCSLAK